PAATPAGPLVVSTPALATGVQGIGVVRPAQTASLGFAAQGLVDRVLVQEGDSVKPGQLLAVLDVRPFDAQVAQAQAAVALAQAAMSGLSEAPRAADQAAATAQMHQAQIALAQARIGQTQGVRSARAALDAAQGNLQATRTKLAAATVQAQAGLDIANQALVQAQARYTQTQTLWTYVQSHPDDPLQPVKGQDPRTGAAIPNTLTDAGRENYHTQAIQAQAALQQAHDQVQQAQSAYDAARQGETTGVDLAQQQVTQAQAALAVQDLPGDADKVAAAQALLDSAQATLDRLSAPPRASDLAAAQARLQQAQAGLQAAQLARGYAELHAPFAGVIGNVRIHPGDPATAPGLVPITLVDQGPVHVDVDINDVDIAAVQVGQAVDMVADARPDQHYPGMVSYIAPDATVNNNTRTYTVRVQPAGPASLRPGMRMRVQITP
ncbi:MAG TPA: efflux RND transporter periplasmic adaptor subunit, partial [Chloroflexia bacterium]|nr:efflux RND transporter periplasmic adaptor subunit [Chloroflexia bacterium]